MEKLLPGKHCQVWQEILVPANIHVLFFLLGMELTCTSRLP